MPFFLKLQKLPAKVRIKNEPTKQSARFSSSPITLSSNGDLPKDFQLYPKERQKDIVRDAISYFRLKYYWTDMIDKETEQILSLLDNNKDIPYNKLGFGVMSEVVED
jgi:hypothetical protein